MTGTTKNKRKPTKADLEAELGELRAKLAKAESSINETEKAPIIHPMDDSDSKIDRFEYIEVMSLTDGQLSLSTEPFGKGLTYTFEKFGETKRITFEKLMDIIEARRTFMERGYFYIMDDRVIRIAGLTHIYDKILPREDILKVFSDEYEDAKDTFDKANDGQKEVMIYILEKKLFNDEHVDANLVQHMADYCGRDIRDSVDFSKRLLKLTD